MTTITICLMEDDSEPPSLRARPSNSPTSGERLMLMNCSVALSRAGCLCCDSIDRLLHMAG